MTREEQLKYCKICENKKLDLKQGIICKLTDERADFLFKCDSFVEENIITKSPKAKTQKSIQFVSRDLFLVLTLTIINFFGVIKFGDYWAVRNTTVAFILFYAMIFLTIILWSLIKKLKLKRAMIFVAGLFHLSVIWYGIILDGITLDMFLFMHIIVLLNYSVMYILLVKSNKKKVAAKKASVKF